MGRLQKEAIKEIIDNSEEIDTSVCLNYYNSIEKKVEQYEAYAEKQEIHNAYLIAMDIYKMAYQVHQFTSSDSTSIAKMVDEHIRNNVLLRVLGDEEDINNFYNDIDSFHPKVEEEKKVNTDFLRDGKGRISKELLKSIVLDENKAPFLIAELQNNLDTRLDEYEQSLDDNDENAQEKFNKLVKTMYYVTKNVVHDDSLSDFNDQIQNEILPKLLNVDQKKVNGLLNEIEKAVNEFDIRKSLEEDKKAEKIKDEELIHQTDEFMKNFKENLKKEREEKNQGEINTNEKGESVEEINIESPNINLEDPTQSYSRPKQIYVQINLTKEDLQKAKEIADSFEMSNENVFQVYQNFFKDLEKYELNDDYNVKKEATISILAAANYFKHAKDDEDIYLAHEAYRRVVFDTVPSILGLRNKIYDEETGGLYKVNADVEARKVLDAVEISGKDFTSVYDNVKKELIYSPDYEKNNNGAILSNNTKKFIVNCYGTIESSKGNNDSYVDVANYYLSQRKTNNPNEEYTMNKAAALVYLKDAHNSRSILSKLAHPIENIKEFFKIKSLYSDVKNDLGNHKEFDSLLEDISNQVKLSKIEENPTGLANQEEVEDRIKIDSLAADTDLNRSTTKDNAKDFEKSKIKTNEVSNNINIE